MKEILKFRQSVKEFCSKYDMIITPVVRFILYLIMYMTLNSMTGYSTAFGSTKVAVLMAVISAVTSDGIGLGLGALLLTGQLFSANVEIGVVFLLLFLVLYCAYIRFFPKTIWIVLFAPVFFLVKLQFLLPILAGMLVGPAAMFSVGIGCIIYYFMIAAGDYVDALASAGGTEIAASYKFIFEALKGNKELVLTVAVFAVIVLIVAIIYKLSFDYSWYVAIAIGGVFEIILFLVGNVTTGADMSLTSVVIGSLVSVIVAAVVQFWKTVVDYSKVEKTQFEDDEYYYYVKAVPKFLDRKKPQNLRTVTSYNDEELDEYLTEDESPARRQAPSQNRRPRPQAGQEQNRQPARNSVNAGRQPQNKGAAGRPQNGRPSAGAAHNAQNRNAAPHNRQAGQNQNGRPAGNVPQRQQAQNRRPRPQADSAFVGQTDSAFSNTDTKK
jgi:hypothetical protein